MINGADWSPARTIGCYESLACSHYLKTVLLDCHMDGEEIFDQLLQRS